jgi:hypothetical protein
MANPEIRDKCADAMQQCAFPLGGIISFAGLSPADQRIVGCLARKRSATSAVHKSHIDDLNSVKQAKKPSKTGVFCSCSQTRSLAERRMNKLARCARNIFGRTKARRVVALPG